MNDLPGFINLVNCNWIGHGHYMDTVAQGGVK